MKKEITKETILRNCEITDMYATGNYTMEEIRKKFNLLRERVRQIIVKYGSQSLISIVKEQRYKKIELKMASQSGKYNKLRITKYLKSLENQKLIWHWNWLCCINCQTTKIKYQSKGLCCSCYSKKLYTESENRREQAKKATYNWRKNNPERSKIIVLRAVKKYNKKHREKINQKSKENHKRLYGKDMIYTERMLIYSMLKYYKNKPDNFKNRIKIKKLKIKLKYLKQKIKVRKIIKSIIK